MSACSRGPLHSLSPAQAAAFWATATSALIDDFGRRTDLHCLMISGRGSVLAPTTELLAALHARGIDATSWDACAQMRLPVDRYKSASGRDLRYVRLGISVKPVPDGTAIEVDYSPVFTEGPPGTCTGVGRYVLAGQDEAWHIVKHASFTLCE
jgi:hypothetical protein